MDDEILSSQTEYKYAPLQGPHSVRLLTLHPAASYETPIRISLREASLDVSVKFAAVSYTWATEDGDCSLSKRVECDGAIIKITANCDAAIRRIRQVEIGFDVWIDAICINQSNDDEKSLQIPLMRQIYGNALWVALWIGEASCTLDEETSRPVTDLAMEFFHNFAIELQGSKDSGQNPRGGTLYQEVVRERKAFRRRGVGAFSPPIRGLWEILHRPWWKRLWVVQEVSIARSPVLLCGSQSVTFDKVEVVIDGLVREHPGKSGDEHEFCANFINSTFPHFVMRDFVKRAQLQSDYTFGNAGPGQKAIQILDNTRNLRATDPRDKIYGIQGFFGVPQSDPENIFPTPDYSKTAADLYGDVARGIIIKTKTLDVLSTCYGCVRTIPDLPSWAPSWNHTPLAYFSVTDFKAANDSDVVYEASGDRQSLKLKGKRVDVVKHVPEIPGRLEYTDLECTRLWRQWTDFAFSLQSYPTGESIADVLLHTLCWGNNTALKRLALGEYRTSFEVWLKILQSSNPLEAVARDLYEDEMACSYTHRAEFLIWGRSLSTTVNSHLALVPISASADDQIVVLSGGKIPFVLRATGNTFLVIGPCYVHGIMDGEGFPREEAAEDLEWFTLR
jgi:hypothetical protein